MLENSDPWKAPPTEKQKKQLDIELIEELNETYEEDGNEALSGKSALGKFKIRLIAFATVIIFALIIMGNMFKVFTLPPLDFITRSIELIKDPEIGELRQSVVVVNALDKRGTGFNIDKGGLIVTNYHVIEGANLVTVNFIDGNAYPVKEIKGFPEVDLAILKITAEDLPSLELETDMTKELDKDVLFIGNPLGFTRVADKGKAIGFTKLKGWEDEVMLIEGSIYKGSSGSPVFNSDGKVVAIVFATISSKSNSETDEIIGLAVPVNQLLENISALDISS